MDIRKPRWFIQCRAVNGNAWVRLLGFHRDGRVGGRCGPEVRQIHRQQHWRAQSFQAVAHWEMRLLWRHSHLLAVLGGGLFLNPLVRLVLTFREGLAALKPAQQPDEEAEEDKRSKTRDKSQTFDIKAGPGVSAVQKHVSKHVRHVGRGVNVGGAPLVSKGAVVKVLQSLRLFNGVDLLTRADVLAVLIGFVKDLVLPHVKVQNQHEEDDAIVKPLACNEKSRRKRKHWVQCINVEMPRTSHLYLIWFRFNIALV